MKLAPLITHTPQLTTDQKQRYARHFTLPGIGPQGQARLTAARVLSIGAGGLGSPALQYLAAAGIGTIGIIDNDTVDISNLQRQIIHTEHTVGQPKTTSAAHTLHNLNSNTTINQHNEQLTHQNALNIINQYDLVLDGSDNFATRYIVNDACEHLNKPLIWGTISQYTAQVSTFWAHPTLTDNTTTDGPTLRDLYPEIPPADSVPTCAAGGVLGSLCGTIGSIMATEATKLITGLPTPLIGALWMYDARTHTVKTLQYSRENNRQPTPLEQTFEQITEANHTLTEEPIPEITHQEITQNPQKYALIDVRQPEERTTGHYNDIAHHPHEQLIKLIQQGKKLTELIPELNTPENTPKTPVIYCAAGIRSAKVVRALAKNQPNLTIYSLKNGYRVGE